MSDCQTYIDRFSAFLAQQLTATEQAEIQSHLDTCADCSDRLSFMRGFKRQVSEAEKTEYPADVHSRLTALLATEAADNIETPEQAAFMRGFKTLVSEAEKTEYPADVHSRLTASLAAEAAGNTETPEQAAFMRGFKTLVSEAEKTEYPADVHSRLTASLEKEKQIQGKVVPLGASRSKSKLTQRLVRYVAAAAIVCVGGLGLTKFGLLDTTPDAVVSLVAHHDTCWNIAPSRGRQAQYDRWLEKLGQKPPAPTVSSDLVAYDKRECPAGEVRGGHLLYNKGEQKVSVYILPADQFTASYGQELKNHHYQDKNVVLSKKGDWVYGVVAELPASELQHLVDTDHVAMLEMYLAAQSADGPSS